MRNLQMLHERRLSVGTIITLDAAYAVLMGGGKLENCNQLFFKNYFKLVGDIMCSTKRVSMIPGTYILV